MTVDPTGQTEPARALIDIIAEFRINGEKVVRGNAFLAIELISSNAGSSDRIPPTLPAPMAVCTE